MSSFQELIYKNGKIVGLTMNSDIATALHDVHSMVSNIATLQTEVETVKKDATDKDTQLSQQLSDITSRIETEHADTMNTVKNISTSLICPDFTMSEPPTLDELNAINSALVAGSLYTINGGNAVLVYRGTLY
jgi:hypothetical protein